MIAAFLLAIAPFVRVGMCESRMTNVPPGGYWQFEAVTWRATTGLPGVASDYSIVVQLKAAVTLERERGWEPWPYCGRFA